MGRILIKGGVWKNTEDEILKAAVMKYGKNQWSRIASLLHRKSSKQCKARWYEWLDPEIKKTEWSREEEEKLLHLAKLMPTQWRTIAPIIGRTAAQCLEHYERLLDQAQAADGDIDLENDPRRLRPGEIDPNPHTKPARPDQVDMDEDEKEMLSEARARLANTQGKKAKRKAREKQLEEARRLAMLQKRRELRAAGIDPARRQKRRRGVDYNADIPFEKKPAVGFFDTSSDGAPAGRVFKPMSLEEADGGPRRDKIEQQKRKEDKKRHEELMKKDATRAVMQMNNMRDDITQRKRSKLVMPEPQTSDRELEDLVKMSHSAEAAANAASGSGANLLQEYSSTPAAGPTARTPRAAKQADTLLTEAQNIIALNQTDSVLEGGENTPLIAGGGSFSGMTPDTQALSTPNTVLTTPFRGATPGATPSRTPSELAATPLRDKLNINAEQDSSLLTPRSAAERERQLSAKADLRDGLDALPKPSTEFEIVAPELAPPDEDEQLVRDGYVEDAADVDARKMEQIKEAERKLFKRQTQVFQRGLPIPKDVNERILRTSAPQNIEQEADEIIKAEMLELIKRDKGMKSDAGLEDYTEDEIASAKAMLAEEIDFVKTAMDHTDRETAHETIWFEMQREAFYIPSQKGFGRYSNAAKKDKLASFEQDYNTAFSAIAQDAKKAEKMEKKQVKLTKGYDMKTSESLKNIVSLCDQIAETRITLSTFQSLRDLETVAGPWRKQCLSQDVATLEARENEQQKRYKDLLATRDALYTAKATVSAAPSTNEVAA